jgi:hypothetical protein
MNTIKSFFDFFIGWTGSSQNPAEMSARFSSIILVVVSKAVMFATMFGYVLPYTDAQLQGVASSLAFVFATIYWVYGAIRAVLNRPKVAGFLKG